MCVVNLFFMFYYFIMVGFSMNGHFQGTLKCDWTFSGYPENIHSNIQFLIKNLYI
jgi:hypothetical protein